VFVAVITRPSAHPAPSAGTAVDSHTTRLGGRKLFSGGSRAAGTYGHVKRVHSTRVPQPVALRWPTHGSRAHHRGARQRSSGPRGAPPCRSSRHVHPQQHLPDLDRL